MALSSYCRPPESSTGTTTVRSCVYTAVTHWLLAYGYATEHRRLRVYTVHALLDPARLDLVRSAPLPLLRDAVLRAGTRALLDLRLSHGPLRYCVHGSTAREPTDGERAVTEGEALGPPATIRALRLFRADASGRALAGDRDRRCWDADQGHGARALW